ncbi:DNA-3-methyladenine glycosylase [Gemmatimonadota bacterium Y43]|uniref:DNA-3-methyladenine glycosylase n=1 Tax=Gaopeijia maritima TaxID=3119007 RepID=UPI003274D928
MAGAADAGRPDREGLPWQVAGEPLVVSGCAAHPLPRFDLPVPDVARALLGSRLESTIGGERVTGVVVETEAYLGADDPASHAATRAGVTERNRAMFGPAGRAYVYRSYGMHWCLNVVAGAEGTGGAVLVRGLEVIEGLDLVRRRRGRDDHPADGPGRLAVALGVTGEHYGHDLARPPLRLLPGWRVPDEWVRVTPRIGIRKAAERLLRYCVSRSPGVSR